MTKLEALYFWHCPKTKQAITLGGNINVCIIGDPSTAKSQFLKCLTSIY